MKALVKKITKYWKWGTPNIETIGTVTGSRGSYSGFSTTNHLQMPISFNSLVGSKPWVLEAKFRLTTKKGWNPIIGGDGGTWLLDIGVNGNNRFIICLSSNGSSYDITNMAQGKVVLSLDTDYWVRLEFTKTAYILKYSTDGINFATDLTINSTLVQENTPDKLRFGFRYGQFLEGIIYLGYCYASIEGKKVWTGMNTVLSSSLDFDFTTQSTACQSYRKEGMNHVFFDGKPIQLKIQARTPFSVTATSGWANPANAFDGDLNTVASCGTATDYIEVTYTKPVTLKGINATLWWQAKVSRFIDLRLYSVNGSTETLICTTTGAGEHAMTLTSASFNPISGTKFRIRLAEANSAGDPPTTSYRSRIRRLHLIEGDQ